MTHGPLPLRSRNSRTQSRRPIFAEMLESRVLLSAVAGPNYDLVPSLVSLPAFDGPLVTGTVVSAKLKVKVSNVGTNLSPTTREAVSLYLRPAGGTGATDINITSAPGTVSKVAPGKPATANLGLNIPTTLPSGLAFQAGTYSLVLKVAGGNAGADSVVLVPLLTITDSPGAVHLSASLSSAKISPTIVSGKATSSGRLSFTITNAGNIPTTLYPSVTVSLALTSTDGSTGITLVQPTNFKLSALKAVGGRKGAVKDTYTLQIPALTAAETTAIPSGSYTLKLTITPVAASAGVPALPAIVITGPTISVTGGTSAGGHVWSHGDTITFTANQQLTGTNFLERGTFVTNTNQTGSYAFTPLGLVLTYDAGGAVDQDTFAFTGAPAFLDPAVNGVGQKVIFSFDPTGAFLSLPNRGNGTQTAFAKYA